jgi:hypothetical protein
MSVGYHGYGKKDIGLHLMHILMYDSCSWMYVWMEQLSNAESDYCNRIMLFQLSGEAGLSGQSLSGSSVAGYFYERWRQLVRGTITRYNQVK